MAYYNNRYQNNGAYNNRYQNNGGYNNNRNYNQKPSKKSGCKITARKDDGEMLIRGWKVDKTNGMRSFLAAPYSKTKTITSKTGRQWENWMVKVQPNGGKPFIVSGLFDVMTKKVIIPELQYVMNPNAPNGGYIGPYFRRNNR
jgi:hypothetical protein